MRPRAPPLSIECLRSHPHLAPLLARWFHDAWADIEGIAVDVLEAELARNLNTDRTPITWVALEAGRPVGTVSVDVADLPGREQYTPWLASFYVVADRRGHGVGRELLHHAQRFAAGADAGVLYLWTAGTTRLYEALGWEPLETLTWGTYPITVMRWQAHQATCADPPCA